MKRIVAVLASILTSLGLTGFAQDEDRTPSERPSTDLRENRLKTPRVRVAREAADPVVTLEKTYDRLVRLRAERPEGRPKELLDRAVTLYRRAVEGAQSDDEARQREARDLAIAARALTRAVEELNNARRADRPDPDLPLPPRRARARVEPQKMEAGDLPPPLTDATPPGERPREKTTRKKAEEADHPDDLSSAVGVRSTPEGTVIEIEPGKVGDLIRGLQIPSDDEQVRELTERLRELAAQATEAAVGVANEALRHRHRDLNVTLSEARQFGPALARRDLERAYDQIQDARREFPGADAQFYLDAARDLYNDARRDAQEGRFERASRLARAAKALALVPEHLPGPDRAGEPPSEPEREEPAGETSPVPKAGPDRPGRHEGPKAEFLPGTGGEEPGTMEGIGAALVFEEDRVIVDSIVPGSPAARDGRLHEGDRILGIEQDGERIEFDGKEAAEVLNRLDGKSGTTVKLIVQPKGSDQEKVIELKRGKFEVPGPIRDRAPR